MAVRHSIAADGTFSAEGVTAWDADHTIEDASLTPAMLDRVYTVPADLDAYQLSSLVSSAAFRDSSYFAVSTVISSAAFRAESYFAISTVISSAAFTASSLYAISTHRVSHQAGGADTLNITSLPGFPGGATFLRADSTWATPPGGPPSAHASTHITSGSDIIANFATTSTGLVPLSVGSTAQFLRGDAIWATPAGGSDPWTYLKVSGTHFGTSTSTFKNIPGLSFVVGINSTYEVEMSLMLKTSTATVNPRIQYRWPTATSSVGWINLAQTNSTQLMSFGNQMSTMNTLAAGGLATTTAAWPCIGGATIMTFGASASSFGVMMATETGSTFVTTCINSWLKYRTI